MKKQRPVNLDFNTMRFPVTAIVSILHRTSGVVLFFFVPFLLWVFKMSLSSHDSFHMLRKGLTTPLAKVVVWVFLVALIYHLLAGIRHLLMDLHIGESLKGGRFSARLTLVLTIILALVVGGRLW